MEKNEKLIIEAKEQEHATITVHAFAPIKYTQSCLLCENTRELPEGMTYCSTPWVCDNCKETIEFVKQLKVKYARDPLEPILD
jgi:hypothetical protein